MRNFFRRKPEKATLDSTNQQNNPDGSSSTSFGEDHPYFKNGTPVSASDILKKEDLQKKFPKLSIWLRKYPSATGANLYNGCTDLLKIYCFEKMHLDNSYHEFRQFALKNQINEGFNLVLKFERSVNNFKVDVGTAFTDPPFDDLTHLVEAHKYWRLARQQDFAMQLIKFEVNEIVLKKYMDLKQTAVHLVSLLAAIDAVTLNCIPYISFSKLMVPKEVIIQSSPLSQRLENLASKYAQKSIQSIQEIDKVRAKFDFVLNSTPNSGNDKADINQINREREQLQAQAFKQMLTKQYLSPSTNLTSNLYDNQNHSLSISADSSFFFDFVSHPKCITYSYFKEYEANPCLETYRKLVSGVIDTFSLKGEEATLTTYLCSLSFAQQMAPEVYYQIPEKKTNPVQNNVETPAGKTETEKSVANDNNQKITQEDANAKAKQTELTSDVQENQPQPEEPHTTSETSSQQQDNSAQQAETTSQTQENQNQSAETTSQATTETEGTQANSEQSTDATPQTQEATLQPQDNPEQPVEGAPQPQEKPTEENHEQSSEVTSQSQGNPEQPTETTSQNNENQSQQSTGPSQPPETASSTSLQQTTATPDDNPDEETRTRMLSVGFDVFIAADPILTLRAISRNMNVEYSTEGSVKYIINCLKMITPKWKEILKFVVDCSIQEYLPPKLRSIRYVINEIVSV